ncbi:hypothetical protein ACWEPM_20325 [Streptomyces sp. NPDC004244]
MHRQRLARLEEQSLRAGGELDEVGYAARLAADLDDVAALHVDRSDLDIGGEGAAGGRSPHWFAWRGSDVSSGVWQEQSQAS